MKYSNDTLWHRSMRMEAQLYAMYDVRRTRSVCCHRVAHLPDDSDKDCCESKCDTDGWIKSQRVVNATLDAGYDRV